MSIDAAIPAPFGIIPERTDDEKGDAAAREITGEDVITILGRESLDAGLLCRMLLSCIFK
jgi:hypothetical protein